MRISVVLAVALALAWALPARAADVPKDKASTGGGAAGVSSGGLTGSGGTGVPGDADLGGLLRSKTGMNATKWWEIGGGWESHALIRQDDLGGSGAHKIYNAGWVYARFQPTKDDRLTLRFGFYENHIADGSETGWRTNDLSLAYAHLFHLPYKWELRASVSATAPTSFYSQKAGGITALTFMLGLERSFGPFSLDLRAFGGPNICRYNTTVGGSDNSSGILGGLAVGEFRIPYVKGLYLGLDLYSAYIWHYDVTNATNPNATFLGTVTDPTFPHQPVQQVYGGEVFVRYDFPRIQGFRADLTVAFAQGDPSMGYTSINHDGADHVYLFWRHNSEVYGVFSIRY